VYALLPLVGVNVRDSFIILCAWKIVPHFGEKFAQLMEGKSV